MQLFSTFLSRTEVAHIKNPVEHIKITACIPTTTEFLITDTVNQILITNPDYSQEFIWAILNSTLINWFAYHFIFGKAIRTMHFDSPITSRIPIPEISESEQSVIVTFVEYILYLSTLVQTLPRNHEDCTVDIDIKLMIIRYKHLVDALVVELYLPDDLHASGKYLMSYLLAEKLQRLEKIDDCKSGFLQKVFQRLFDEKHPLNISLSTLSSLKVFREIGYNFCE